MTTGWVVFIIAVAAVGLLVVGLSLTLIFKGHHIDSEIGTNRHMKKRGIRCTAGEFMREENRHSTSSESMQPMSGCAICNPESKNMTVDCCSCVSACNSNLTKE